MTAAELRALIAGATPGPWTHRIDTSWNRPDRIIESPSMVIIRDENCDLHWKQGRDEHNYNLIVALVNHAERFAERLAAEEAKAEPKREWTSCRPCDGWDYRVDGVYAGQVWPSSSGEWWWCLRDNLDNGIEPTQLLARAAVEAAVREGR